MSISLLVLIVLVILLIGALPTWGYSRSWGLSSDRRHRHHPADRAGAVVAWRFPLSAPPTP